MTSPLVRLRRPGPLRAALGALTVSALVGALALASTTTVQATTGPAVASPVDAAGAGVQGALDDGARTTSFNDGWKFHLVNAADITDPTDAYAEADAPYDDSSWRSLDLPHDWSIELDPTSQGTTAGTGYYQGGLGWYRKTFTLPTGLTGKRISVEFDGVYMDSTST